MRRGLFRLWVVLALVWILGAAWELRANLRGDCEQILSQPGADAPEAYVICSFERLRADYGDVGLKPEGWPIHTQVIAAEWIFLPPLTLFVIGSLGLWVARGFQRPYSN